MTLEASPSSPADPDRTPSLGLSPAEPGTVQARGPLSLLRRRTRRWLGRNLATLGNALFPTPLGRWLHGSLLTRLEVRVVEVELKGSSAAVQWPTIAFLSDMHAGHYMTADDLERLAGLTMGLNPDMVCLGGDLINHHPEEMELLWPALARLRAPLGVFAVPGNHDYVKLGQLGGWIPAMEAHGVRVLMNRGVRIEHGASTFWLAGVDDLTEGHPRLGEALTGRRTGEPCLLLSHHPDLFVDASAHGVDLQLSGHTHGGQIRLLGWAPMHHSGFGWVNGIYRRGTSSLFVGRGAGVTALPLRIGTRAEITLLRPRGVRQPAGTV